MAPERTIARAVAMGDRVYKAGDEAALLEAFAGKTPGAHLTDGESPVLVGEWGGEKPDAGDKKPAPKK